MKRNKCSSSSKVINAAAITTVTATATARGKDGKYNTNKTIRNGNFDSKTIHGIFNTIVPNGNKIITDVTTSTERI